MEYDNTTGHTINFKNATKIEAGKAYLIKPKKDIKDPVFSDVIIKNVTPIVSGDKDGYSFVGIYSPITFNDSNKDRILILSKEGKFLSVRNGNRMKGMRAYFTIPPKTKAEAVRLMINNKPTAITEITTTLCRHRHKECKERHRHKGRQENPGEIKIRLLSLPKVVLWEG